MGQFLAQGVAIHAQRCCRANLVAIHRGQRLAEQNGLCLDAYRFDTLDFFYTLAGRTQAMEAA